MAFGPVLFLELIVRVRFRPLRKDETDWETVVGLGIVPLFLLVCAAIVAWFPGLLPRCRFHDWLGIPCPGCGSLRCAELLFHGRIIEALLAQPLACIAVFTGAAYSAFSVMAVICHWPRPRLHATAREGKMIGGVAIAAGLANWAYLLISGD